MNDIPKVSIIVPVFNTGVIISKFIKSIIRQSYLAWSLILVDDGCTDDTVSYINAFLKRDNRIVLLRRTREPKGSVACRNIGMLYADGKYIIHFDADDFVGTCCLEQRVSYMEKHPALDFAVFKGVSFFVNENNEIVKTKRKWGRKRKKNDIISFLSNDYPFSVWNCIYKASRFKNIKWDEKVKIYTDLSYILPSLLGDYSYEYVTDCKEDYFYRVNQKNAMTSAFITKEKYESTKYLFSKIDREIAKQKKYLIYKKKFKEYMLVLLERIVNSSNLEIINDFENFYKSLFGLEIRFHFIVSFSKGMIVKGGNRGKKLRFIIALMYRPKIFINWLTTKI